MYASSRRCSPISRKKTGSSGGGVQSCFPWQSLARIARRYNEANPQDKIPLYRNRDQLWRAIKRRMPQCDDEKCWTRAHFLSPSDREQLVEDFKPPIPQGKYSWLNTDDIDRVLRGYEKVFSDFLYLGAHPIDFQTYDRNFDPLHRLLSSKARKAALVLNLDDSTKDGSHWVGVFFDISSRTMEYYDSYGEPAPKLVKEFYHALGKGWKYKENHHIHQRYNSECGVYTIHFIVRRLLGTSFEETTRKVIKDSEMNSKRTTYFDPLEKYNNSI
jgi:hypothetical protein